jgi:hypothetical protein
VVPRGKKPFLDDWEHLHLTEAALPRHFGNGNNIGILVGNPVDVDLDMAEAVALSHWLPPTAARFGRAGKPNSHHLYCVDPIPGTKQYRTKSGAMVVELRSTGGQTVVPPSIHVSGEPIRWEVEGAPGRVDAATVQRAVALVAAGALLAHTWPVEGSRHRASLALAGALLRAGWQQDEVWRFIVDVAKVAGDDEAEERGKNVATTAQRIAAGERATGWPGVVQVFGADVVAKVCEWLEIDTASHTTTKDPYADLGEDFGRTRPRPPERPALPLDTLGVPWLQEFITKGADAVRSPIDFVAGAVLGACSAALAGAVRLHVMNNFYVFPALWIALVGVSGCAKGPAYDLASTALQDAQSERHRAYLEQWKKYLEDLNTWESLPKKDRAGEERPEPPPYMPIAMDDVTTEKVIEVLAANPRGVPLLVEELLGWVTGMNQYKRGGNDRQRWLRIRDSRPVQADRKSGPPIRADRPVMPLLGTTQPGPMGRAFRGSDDGLRERVCVVYPPDVGMLPLEEREPIATLGRYRSLITGLLAVTLQEDGKPRLLRLTKEARAAWTAEERIICDATTSATFDPAQRSAYAKGRGIAAQVACLLAVVRHVAALVPGLEEGEALKEEVKQQIIETFPRDVGADVVRDAWQITAWFLDHGDALYRENRSGGDKIQRAVHLLEQRGGEATLRDLARAAIAGDQSVRGARDLVAALVDRGLARVEQRATRGRPTTVVILAELEDPS